MRSYCGRRYVVSVMLWVWLSVVSSMSVADPNPSNFAEFWRTFRSAVVSGDYVKLSELAAEEVGVRGPLDSDVTVRISRADLRGWWPKVLAAHPGVPLGVDSMAELVRLRKTPPEPDESGECRLGTFKFRRRVVGEGSGQWELYFIYYP